MRGRSWHGNNSTWRSSEKDGRLECKNAEMRRDETRSCPERSRAREGGESLGFPSCLWWREEALCHCITTAGGLRTADVFALRPFGHRLLKTPAFACVCRPLMLLFFQSTQMRCRNGNNERSLSPIRSHTHSFVFSPDAASLLKTITQKLL